MALLIRILLNTCLFHVSLMFLMFSYLSSSCFSSLHYTCGVYHHYFWFWRADFLLPNNLYDFFQDKGRYSMFDISCQSFWIPIFKILVSHISKNKVMSHEHIVSLQSNVWFLLTSLPIIVLHFSAFRETMVTVVCRQLKYGIFWWTVWLKVLFFFFLIFGGLKF